MQVELTEVDSSTCQRKIVVDRLPVMIGQSPDAGVRLDHHWVSRQHCEISAIKDTLVVRDLGSMLGTFVNGLNVTTAHLMPGDKLTIGSTSFLVDYERRNGTRRARRAHPETQPSSRASRDRPLTDSEPTEPASGPTRGKLPRLVTALFGLPLMRLRRKPR
jgi:pSer/pThr/pTyr-binding forkhead associated (FHA) protein